ncbi:hypothetical protein [Hydrogenophaga sp.]|uniref:hypothetical protein n=1 Tax=Hydrogenophaga sp. TaxID=1904254 RepID=UPI00271B612D|nr:hypothetical protein [Hydrogenophaga sp.]MDO9438577.1 hypothetical protein [Hydrogenophaga sp.]
MEFDGDKVPLHLRQVQQFFPAQIAHAIAAGVVETLVWVLLSVSVVAVVVTVAAGVDVVVEGSAPVAFDGGWPGAGNPWPSGFAKGSALGCPPIRMVDLQVDAYRV